MSAATGYSRFLRQYMREPQRHQLVEAEETDSGRTMQLFPTRAGGGTSSSSHEQSDDGAQAANKATLSIFYEGRMLVFEEFPADKAKALMQLAAGSSGSSAAAPNNKDAPVPVVRVPEQPAATAPLAVVPSDLLPIARKVSLQRFLQKRKERIAATEPYPEPEKDDVPATATATGWKATALKDKPAPASWLGL